MEQANPVTDSMNKAKIAEQKAYDDALNFVAKYAELNKERKRLEGEAKKIKKEMDEMTDTIFQIFETYPQYPNFPTLSGTVTLRRELFTNAFQSDDAEEKKALKQNACEAVKRFGLAEIVAENFDSRTLRSKITEMEHEFYEENEDATFDDFLEFLGEDFTNNVKIAEVNRVVVTASKAVKRKR